MKNLAEFWHLEVWWVPECKGWGPWFELVHEDNIHYLWVGSLVFRLEEI